MSGGRVELRPDGSPMSAVKSPMISTTTWPEVLELPQLAQRNRMAEVQVGRGGIDTELDAQRPAALELALEIGLGHRGRRCRS